MNNSESLWERYKLLNNDGTNEMSQRMSNVVEQEDLSGVFCPFRFFKMD